MRKRVFRTTKVNLSELFRDDPDVLEKVEMAYIDFENHRRKAVEDARLAASAKADADISSAQVLKSQMDFLTLVTRHEPEPKVATEAGWLPPYRNSSGQIILECPVTMRDQRILSRAVKAQVSKQVEEIDDSDLFDDEEED